MLHMTRGSRSQPCSREVYSEAPDVLPDYRRRQTDHVLLGDSLRQTRGPGLANLLNARGPSAKPSASRNRWRCCQQH
jgi:hypothetical protein